MRLEGKVCLITGGGSGIGRATCELFAREGARLVIVERNEAAAKETAALCGGDTTIIVADLGKEDDIERAIATTRERFGRIDILVNNAGYGIAGSVLETSRSDWEALMNVNVTGLFLMCKGAIPIMVSGGVIVNVASVVAQVGIANRAAYCASKGAVASLTRAMAIDHVDDKIRVNAVAPGTIHSPYFDEILEKAPDPAGTLKGLQDRQLMKRLGTPEEIANAILYLAGDESSFCTGAILTVDGGMTAY
ncbi:SDR family oxidoreductase [Acuticoccus sp. M5D2P5]|uniref:SDR family oxidoreductase n=1 Tax=Acuticoccus kalidii TaxID=2910977 RepID=UPI001F30B73D|nr:SDR family oxidoreductase [Acuticoccus kalidii]MCF3935228.1 SDR family oxidoreductase [Acuticoccus kalidii]